MPATDQQLHRLSKIVDASGDAIRVPQRRLPLRYDGAETNDGNELHWAMSDNLDPHGSATDSVRRKLRSRSRYEVSENNPYLKGSVITISNDFVGTGGPTLQIIDDRLSDVQKRAVERAWKRYCKAIKLRQKLWRMRMSKLVDGESFAFAFVNRRTNHPVPIDWILTEPEQVGSPGINAGVKKFKDEVDGVRIDKFGDPYSYFRLNRHPGSNYLLWNNVDRLGKWIDSKHVIHWYRRDRSWVRGIPELAASLSTAALLRRTIMAYIQHEEIAASIGGVLETDGPAINNPYTNNNEVIQDDPFDTFPINRGMMMNLPYGYKLKQFQTAPAGDQIDAFISTMLKAILRPVGIPYILGSGSSDESNMSSAVVDTHIYRGTQQTERAHCEEEVLDKIIEYWWPFAKLISGYLGVQINTPEVPEHRWLWPRVGIDHTDPSKVAQGIVTLLDAKVLTDRDVQESYYNRDVEDWRKEVEEDHKFREQFAPAEPQEDPQGGSKPEPKKQKTDK